MDARDIVKVGRSSFPAGRPNDLRAGSAHEMPPENLVPDYRVEVLTVRTAEGDSGNWTKGRISLIWTIEDRSHPSLLIANLNSQECRYE